MLRDAERVAASAGLDLTIPSDFPHNTVLPARVACSFQDAPWAFDFVCGVYAAEFVRGENVGSADVISRVLMNIGVPDPAAVLEEAQSVAGKAKLKAQTEEAISLGLFGAPSFVVGDRDSSTRLSPEIFWGQDRVGEAVAWALGRHALQLRQSRGVLGEGGRDTPRL
jgi:2-hydroxychromene-2-carboxylate isomerase